MTDAARLLAAGAHRSFGHMDELRAVLPTRLQPGVAVPADPR
jgi:hypothetical protein